MPTPHDALFRHTFGDPVHAGPLLRALLDPAITAVIDWSTLRRVPDVAIDERQRELCTDLMFTVRLLGRDAFLWLLPEHKSRPDRWAPLQMLGYQVVHWQRLRREQPRLRKLPPIVPVIVHCGARRWRASCDLRALLDLDGLPPGLAASQPQLVCPVHDFAGRSPVRALSSYLLSSTKLSRRRLQVVIQRRFGSTAMKKFVSTLERERIEGWAQGLAEGRSQAKAETLLRQLQKRFGDIPAATQKRILAARTADLDRWLDRVLDAETLAAVFRRA
jgi:predicted transposase YdaD